MEFFIICLIMETPQALSPTALRTLSDPTPWDQYQAYFENEALEFQEEFFKNFLKHWQDIHHTFLKKQNFENFWSPGGLLPTRTRLVTLFFKGLKPLPWEEAKELSGRLQILIRRHDAFFSKLLTQIRTQLKKELDQQNRVFKALRHYHGVHNVFP